MNVLKLFPLVTLLIIVTSCGGEKTTQEEKAFEDVMDIVEDLPETLKEAEEFVEEENSDVLTGSLSLTTGDNERVISSWLARRSTITFMDGNFSFRSCSNGDCDEKFLLTIASPDLYTQELPIKLSSSIFDKTNAKIIFTDKDKIEHITKEGEFTLNKLSNDAISIDYNGIIFKGIGVDGEDVDAKLSINFEFNFISKDLRTKE